eukprot:scaffold666852_cov32-Prasinocladus_malaysianus.AAC.1
MPKTGIQPRDSLASMEPAASAKQLMTPMALSWALIPTRTANHVRVSQAAVLVRQSLQVSTPVNSKVHRPTSAVVTAGTPM